MPLVIETERPPLRTEEDGTVRVGESRVTLDVLLSAYSGGAGPEQIVRQFPTVSLADTYAVIGYYLRNRDRVDAYLRERKNGPTTFANRSKRRARQMGFGNACSNADTVGPATSDSVLRG